MTYTHTITIDKHNPMFSEDYELMCMMLSVWCQHVRFKLQAYGRIELNTIRYIFSVDLDPTINPVFDSNDMTNFDIRYENIDNVWVVTVEAEYK